MCPSVSVTLLKRRRNNAKATLYPPCDIQCWQHHEYPWQGECNQYREALMQSFKIVSTILTRCKTSKIDGAAICKKVNLWFWLPRADMTRTGWRWGDSGCHRQVVQWWGEKHLRKNCIAFTLDVDMTFARIFLTFMLESPTLINLKWWINKLNGDPFFKGVQEREWRG